MFLKVLSYHCTLKVLKFKKGGGGAFKNFLYSKKIEARNNLGKKKPLRL